MLEAVQYARSLPGSQGDVRAIHIETEADRPRPSLVAGWERFGLDIPLVVLQSPYRNLVEPLVGYMDAALTDGGFDCVTLVLPEFVVTRWWEQLLHNQTALWLQFVLRNKPGVIVANYRYYLSREHPSQGADAGPKTP
jgi:hypothetical protein